MRSGDDMDVVSNPSAASVLRLGLIGAGGFGTYTTELLDRQPEIELVGVADVEPELAERLGVDRGVPHL